MRFPSALAVVCLAAAPCFAQSFDQAVAELKARVVKEGGAGLVVMVDRVDVFTVKMKAQAVGTTFTEFAVKPWDNAHASVFSYSGKATDAVEGTAQLNEEPNVLAVEAWGPDFRPKLTMKLPRRGEKPEVSTIYIGEKAGAAK